MDETAFGFDLGAVGPQRVRQCLNEGMYLGPTLLPELNLEEGRVAVLGAHGEPPHDDVKALQWSVAHLDVLDKHDSAAALIELLKILDSKAGKIAAIVENNSWKPGDPAAQRLMAKTNTVIAGGSLFTIYDLLSFDEPDQVIRKLNMANGYVLNCFIVPTEIVSRFVESVEGQDLKSLALALVGTIHEVYDGEGYIAWIRE